MILGDGSLAAGVGQAAPDFFVPLQMFDVGDDLTYVTQQPTTKASRFTLPRRVGQVRLCVINRRLVV